MEEENYKLYNYSKWTETQFFNVDQVQEVIGTEYPDERWTIDSLNRNFFQVDINNIIVNKKQNYAMELEIKGMFTRKGPPGKELSKGAQYKELDFTQLDDCMTGKKLLEFANLDCSLKKN